MTAPVGSHHPLRVAHEMRLPDARLAGDNQVPAALLGQRPRSLEGGPFDVSADDLVVLQLVVLAVDGQHPEEFHGAVDPSKRSSAERSDVDPSVHKPKGVGADQHHSRRRLRLHAGGEIGRFANYVAGPRPRSAAHIRNDGQPGVNTDSHLEVPLLARGLRSQTTRGVDDRKGREHRPQTVVLVRPRVAEIHEKAVAHEVRNMTCVLTHDLRARLVVGVEDFARLFGIARARDLCRALEIAEHHGDAPWGSRAAAASAIAIADDQSARSRASALPSSSRRIAA